MTSTLQGKFIDYSATFEHIDSLGDPRLSLIDSVEIHELIHQFQSQKPGSDNQPDFLANDGADPNRFEKNSIWIVHGVSSRGERSEDSFLV